MEIRVFKMTSHSGCGFQYQEDTNRYAYSYRMFVKLEDLARALRARVEEHLKSTDGLPIALIFSPFGDVEHYEGLDPWRCHALSEKEQLVFWKAYSEISKGGGNG